MEGTSKNIGVTQRAFDELFIEIRERPDWEFTVHMSVMEVYNEKLHDLLIKEHEELDIYCDKKNVVNVPNLTMIHVKDPQGAKQVFEIGRNNRVIGSTN